MQSILNVVQDITLDKVHSKKTEKDYPCINITFDGRDYNLKLFITEEQAEIIRFYLEADK
jgi:hypothetical protein